MSSADYRRKQRDRAFAEWSGDVLTHPQRYHRLRVARVRAGYTQVELGEIACLCAGFIGEVERGRKVSKNSRRRLARALKMKESDLFDAS
jgi:transcriptional regulator with XRE-family HTH domain